MRSKRLALPSKLFMQPLLWKAFEGTAGIQDSFRKVVTASQTVDTIRNKLTVLRDAEESHEVTLVKDEDVDCKLDLEIEASKDSDALK